VKQRKSSRGERFAAKLLFQYRVLVDGKPNVMRTCEERMIVLRARSARLALSAANRRGKGAELEYTNSDDNPVLFEFVGVLDLLHLGPECEEDEVWYDIKLMKLPKERAKELLPAPQKLNAVYWEEAAKSRPSTRPRQRRALTRTRGARAAR
jgi:hypothetical protein